MRVLLAVAEYVRVSDVVLEGLGVALPVSEIVIVCDAVGVPVLDVPDEGVDESVGDADTVADVDLVIDVVAEVLRVSVELADAERVGEVVELVE